MRAAREGKRKWESPRSLGADPHERNYNRTPAFVIAPDEGSAVQELISNVAHCEKCAQVRVLHPDHSSEALAVVRMADARRASEVLLLHSHRCWPLSQGRRTARLASFSGNSPSTFLFESGGLPHGLIVCNALQAGMRAAV